MFFKLKKRFLYYLNAVINQGCNNENYKNLCKTTINFGHCVVL